MVVVESERETQQDIEQKIKTITSFSGIRVFTYWKVNLPRCDLKPKQIDWMIIGALLKNADRRISEIAQE